MATDVQKCSPKPAPTRSAAPARNAKPAEPKPEAKKPAEAPKDRSTISQEASQANQAPKSDVKNLKQGLSSNFKSDPEAEKRANNEKTLNTLDRYSDFTNGKDSITSREDYQKIAEGQENGDFEKYLKEKNPTWSSEQIASEVNSLQTSSRDFLNNPELFDAADVAHKGGDKDGKISTEDLTAARLKNDISKTSPPQLSVSETVALHEKDPGLGNQAITNRYYHEAQELNKILGGDDKNFIASWPAYATQASNSAGAFVRGDGVPLNDDVQNAVAAGNRKVFEDIAPHYDSYIDSVKKNPDMKFEDWANQQNFEGKPQLEESFKFLDMARIEKDPDKKQEYILASNALAGAHEQARLDPNIDKATAPLTGGGLERGVWTFIANEKPNLFLPTGKGEGDLQAMDVSQKIEPKGPINPAFESIDDPQVRDALKRALGNDQADVSSGQALLDKTGTADWSVLPDRMRTIVGLMVAGHNDSRVGEYPLDYKLPEGPSTWDHVQAVGGSLIDKVPFL